MPPKPSLMSSSRPGLAAYSGQMGQAGAGAGGGDPNRLAVLAQTSAQSSVESGPDTTTEGSVYSTGTGRESTTAPEEEDDVMMMMEEERQQPRDDGDPASDDEDENLNFPPLPALPPEAAAVEAEAAAAASSLLGMASPARDLIRDIEHKF